MAARPGAPHPPDRLDLALRIEDPPSAPMMMATETFTVEYDGEIEEIVAGRDRIVADHEIVAGRPDAFRPMTTADLSPGADGITLDELAAIGGDAFAARVLDYRIERERARNHGRTRQPGRRRIANQTGRPFGRSRQSHRLSAGHRRSSSTTRASARDDPGDSDPSGPPSRRPTRRARWGAR